MSEKIFNTYGQDLESSESVLGEFPLVAASEIISMFRANMTMFYLDKIWNKNDLQLNDSIKVQLKKLQINLSQNIIDFSVLSEPYAKVAIRVTLLRVLKEKKTFASAAFWNSFGVDVSDVPRWAINTILNGNTLPNNSLPASQLLIVHNYIDTTVSHLLNTLYYSPQKLKLEAEGTQHTEIESDVTPEARSARDIWVDRCITAFESLSNKKNPDRTQKQRMILERFFDASQHELIQTDSLTLPNLSHQTGKIGVIKGAVFEALARLSFPERDEEILGFENFLLELIKSPDYLNFVLEKFIPAEYIDVISELIKPVYPYQVSASHAEIVPKVKSVCLSSGFWSKKGLPFTEEIKTKVRAVLEAFSKESPYFGDLEPEYIDVIQEIIDTYSKKKLSSELLSKEFWKEQGITISEADLRSIRAILADQIPRNKLNMKYQTIIDRFLTENRSQVIVDSGPFSGDATPFYALTALSSESFLKVSKMILSESFWQAQGLELTSDIKESISNYLNAIKFFLRYKKDTRNRSDDLIRISVEYDDERKVKRFVVVGVVEAKGYKNFFNTINSVEKQRKIAPRRLVDLITNLTPKLLSLMSESLDLYDVLPNEVTCLPLEELKYDLVISDRAKGIQLLKSSLEDDTTRIVEIPFSHQEVIELMKIMRNDQDEKLDS